MGNELRGTRCEANGDYTVLKTMRYAEKERIEIMRKQILLWVVPVLVMLLLVTALVLTPLLTHAAGAATAPKPAPTQSAPSKQVHPDVQWYY